jgi:hypothetical protein
MINVIERDEMLKKYASNEFEKEYIYKLSEEVYEQVADVIEFMESEGDVTFPSILEQAMVACVHYYDFETLNIIESRFPQVDYIMLQYKASGSDWFNEQDEEGNVTLTIKMLPEQHMIMTLLNTLEGLVNYIYEEGVADKVVIINVENDEEY